MNMTKMETILKEKAAKFVYKGKSKDVYELANGNTLLVYGDGFTGANGVEDPGANHNIGIKEGLGHQNLTVTSVLFEEITKTLKIPTHQISVDLDTNMQEVKKVVMLGKGMPFELDGTSYVAGGLEFIARNKAMGSFLKRVSGYQEGDSLIKDGKPFVEVSVKHDTAEDPFFDRAYYLQQGVPAKLFDQAVDYTAKITKFLIAYFKERSLELMDIKMEFGVDSKGNLVLSDEISPGSLRAFTRNGNKASKDMVYRVIAGIAGKVAVMLGSDSDLPIAEPAVTILEKMDILTTIHILSAHRTPEEAAGFAAKARGLGYSAIIACAGKAAALPGVVASATSLPVIGLPVWSKQFNGLDALVSMSELPPDIPVATMGIDAGKNAGLMAARIVAVSDKHTQKKVEEFVENQRLGVLAKNKQIGELGLKEYLGQTKK